MASLPTLRAHSLDLTRPLVMGVLNVTPDSFSDGGMFASSDAAIEHGLRLVREGADIVDVGGESTRPGATPLGEGAEMDRVLPVVRALASQGILVSVDSTKALVVEAALQDGAVLVNDVGTGDSIETLAKLAAKFGAGYLRMHSRGTPSTMQSLTSYHRGVVTEVTEQLRLDALQILAHGVDPASIFLDPGIGFAKTASGSLALLAHTAALVALGYSVCVGPSRKSFISATNTYPPTWRDQLNTSATERLGGTAAAVTAAILGGAKMIRVHDVAVMTQAARVAFAIRESQFGATDA